MKTSKKYFDEWAYRKYKTTFRKLYYTELNKTLATRLKNLCASGAPLREIAEKEGHSENWVDKRFMDFGIPKRYEQQQKFLEEFVPPMIEKGYTLEKMKKELKKISKGFNVSISLLSDWIHKTYEGKSLIELRTEKKFI